MKLNNKKGNGVDTNNQSEAMNFGIGDVSTIIEILRNRLYSNPIQTLTQEYLSNGRDATREAKKKTPLRVTLPTGVDSVLKVRDFGTGLSPERVKDVFVLYGASTKRADNVQTGGFGIGAKSAWAYTDSFTVISYHKGVCRTYIAHTGKNSNGMLEMLSEEPTTEPTGVEIQIPVKSEDRHKFINAVYRSTLCWAERPEIQGITEVEIPQDYAKFSEKITNQHDNWKVLPKTDFYKQLLRMHDSTQDAFLSVDGILYPMDKFYSNAIVRRMKDSIPHGNFIIIEVSNGDVEISATREAISDKEDSVKGVEEICERVLAGMTQYIQENLGRAHNTLNEYLQTFLKMRQSFQTTLVNYQHFKYVADNVEYKLGNYGILEHRSFSMKTTHFAMKKVRTTGRLVLSSEEAGINTNSVKISFVLRDTDESENKTRERIRGLFESNKSVEHVYLMENIAEAVRDVVPKHFQAVKLSSLPYEAKKKNQAKRSLDKITVRFLTIEGANAWSEDLVSRSHPDLTFDELNADDAKYILVPFSSEEKYKNNNNQFKAMVKFLTRQGKYKVVKLSNRDYRLAEENLDTAYKYDDVIEDLPTFASVPADKWTLIEDRVRHKSDLAGFQICQGSILDEEFRTFVAASRVTETRGDLEINNEVLAKFPRYQQLQEEANKLREEESKFIGRYPVLRAVSLRHMGAQEKASIVEFLNFLYEKANPKPEPKKKRTKKADK